MSYTAVLGDLQLLLTLDYRYCLYSLCQSTSFSPWTTVPLFSRGVSSAQALPQVRFYLVLTGYGPCTLLTSWQPYLVLHWRNLHQTSCRPLAYFHLSLFRVLAKSTHPFSCYRYLAFCSCNCSKSLWPHLTRDQLSSG